MSARLGKSSRIHRSGAGYVLVLTLVVLALAASAMVGLSRAAMSRTLDARRAGEGLQRRWGALSCTATLLPNAEKILERHEALAGGHEGVMRATLVLGGQTFDLVVADEQAKPSANALVYYRGKAAAERAVRTIVRGGRASPLKVRFLAGSTRPLAPTVSADDSNEEDEKTGRKAESRAEEIERPDYHPIESFGQVFSDESPSELTGVAVTCWGDGGLRLRRASAAALAEMCAPVLDAGQIRRLVEIRDQFPTVKVTRALDALLLDADARDEVEDRLADQSSCYSLWVVARGHERSWYHFSIHDGSRPSDSVDSFEW